MALEPRFESTLRWDEGAITRAFKQDATKELLKVLLKIEMRAKALAPVDTGRLRSSIGHEIGTIGGEVAGTVGTNVEYAGYLEFGTYKMSARPFLRPAAQAVLGG